MNELTITLIANGILTPILVFLTQWLKDTTNKSLRQEKRDENYMLNLEKRIAGLEREVREVRVELKNRDAEYLALYKEHTTLRAQYEILEIDHAKLKKDYDATVSELAALKQDIKVKAAEAAENLKTL